MLNYENNLNFTNKCNSFRGYRAAYNDLNVGDFIEAFEEGEVAKTLD